MDYSKYEINVEDLTAEQINIEEWKLLEPLEETLDKAREKTLKTAQEAQAAREVEQEAQAAWDKAKKALRAEQDKAKADNSYTKEASWSEFGREHNG